MYRLERSAGIDPPHTLRLRTATLQIDLPRPLEKGAALTLEAIRNTTAGGPLQAYGHRDVQVQGPVGTQLTLHPVLQHPYACRAKIPTAALVSIRCVRETIADHPSTRRQCWAYDLGQMLCSRREDQQSFSIPGHALEAVIQQQSSDRLPQRRPARLAGDHGRYGPFAQQFGQILETGGLAGAFEALDRNELRGPGTTSR